MRLRLRSCVQWLAIAMLLAVFALPASAGQVYTNGPINGNMTGWEINTGYVVADSFTLSGSNTLTSVDFGAWNSVGDTITSIQWAITTGTPFTGSSVTLFSGTASVSDLLTLAPNSFGFNIFSDSFGLPSLSLGAGTYYLELQGAVVPNGDPAYWDSNDGPSTAYQNFDGLLTGFPNCNTSCSESFTIYGSPSSATPEPGTLTLLGSGLISLVGLRRRRATQS
jgi:hypothetical protein